MIGFGGVGQGLIDILKKKQNYLKESLEIDIEVVAITDINKGSIYHPDGLDLEMVSTVMNQWGSLKDYPDYEGLQKNWDSLKTIRESNADTIIEITYTNVKTGQPAIDHCKAAFQHGKNVVMSNKGPVAIAYKELSELAAKHRVQWGFEGTVMSGTPAIRLPLATLVGNEITEIRGILNGTTNFILGKMEEGDKYETALKEAQRLGYAEADPTSDVEGYDARYKIAILANVILNTPLKVEDIECKGITTITLEDIEQAKMENKRWKLLGSISKSTDGIKAVVQPEKVALTDPLAGVSGATNAITYTCDMSGPITLIGAGAGLIETGYALLIDIININRNSLFH